MTYKKLYWLITCIYCLLIYPKVYVFLRVRTEGVVT
nr:MAG TPA: hypothetical protein [Caudoviricetes sp.]